MDKIVKFIFFGNFFYGFCAVALAIEASLQQGFPLDDLLFYSVAFLATVLYYNVAYITEKPVSIGNARSEWYGGNLLLIKRINGVELALFALGSVYFIVRYFQEIIHLNIMGWIAITCFPLVSFFYYGVNRRLNLRNVGWLKPFIIGFSWAGLVSVFPIVYHCIITGTDYHIHLVNLALFVKNFMFISLLCILFDIKDYASDSNRELKTFVVKVGLRKTIFYIIVPLSVLGLGSFLWYGFTHAFSTAKILINTLPFLTLIAVSYSLFRRRSILYYLIIIDGLMLLKAVCGIVGVLFF
jgi:hypothetical protein